MPLSSILAQIALAQPANRTAQRMAESYPLPADAAAQPSIVDQLPLIEAEIAKARNAGDHRKVRYFTTLRNRMQRNGDFA